MPTITDILGAPAKPRISDVLGDSAKPRIGDILGGAQPSPVAARAEAIKMSPAFADIMMEKQAGLTADGPGVKMPAGYLDAKANATAFNQQQTKRRAAVTNMIESGVDPTIARQRIATASPITPRQATAATAAAGRSQLGNFAAAVQQRVGSTGFNIARILGDDNATNAADQFATEKAYNPNTVGGFVGEAAGSMAQFAPALVAPGYGSVALGLAGTETAGAQLRDIDARRAAGQNIDTGTAYVNAVANAAAEIVGEKFGLGQLQKGMKVGTSMAKTAGNIGKAAVASAGEEAFTQDIQNRVNQATIAPETDVNEGVGRAAAQGAIGAGMILSPAVVAQTVQRQSRLDAIRLDRAARPKISDVLGESAKPTIGDILDAPQPSAQQQTVPVSGVAEAIRPAPQTVAAGETTAQSAQPNTPVQSPPQEAVQALPQSTPPQTTDNIGFRTAFATAKNAATDGIIDSMWDRVQRGVPINRMGKAVLENRLRDAQKQGLLKSRDDVAAIINAPEATREQQVDQTGVPQPPTGSGGGDAQANLPGQLRQGGVDEQRNLRDSGQPEQQPAGGGAAAGTVTDVIPRAKKPAAQAVKIQNFEPGFLKDEQRYTYAPNSGYQNGTRDGRAYGGVIHAIGSDGLYVATDRTGRGIVLRPDEVVLDAPGTVGQGAAVSEGAKNLRSSPQASAEAAPVASAAAPPPSTPPASESGRESASANRSESSVAAPSPQSTATAGNGRIRKAISDMLDGPLSGVLTAGERANVSSMSRWLDSEASQMPEQANVEEAIGVLKDIYDKARARLGGRDVSPGRDTDFVEPVTTPPQLSAPSATAGEGKGAKLPKGMKFVSSGKPSSSSGFELRVVRDNGDTNENAGRARVFKAVPGWSAIEIDDRGREVARIAVNSNSSSDATKAAKAWLLRKLDRSINGVAPTASPSPAPLAGAETPLAQVDDQFVIPGTEEGVRQEMSREQMLRAYRNTVGGSTEDARAGIAEMEKAAAEAAAQSNMSMEDVVSATLGVTDGMADQKLGEQIAGRAVAMAGNRIPKRDQNYVRNERRAHDVRSREARAEVAGLLEQSAKQKDEAARRAQDVEEDTQTTVPVATSNLPQLEETYDAARRRWYKAKDEFDRAGYGTKRKDQLKRRADKLKEEMDAAESVYREARQADNAAKEKAAVAKNPVIAAAVAYKNADTKNIDAATYRKLKADAEKQVRDLAEANIDAAAKSIPDGADRMTDLQEKEARETSIKEYVSAATDSPMMMEKPIIEKLAGMIRGNRLQIYRAQAAERIKGHKERQGIISSSGGRSVYDVYDFEGIDALVEKAKKEADEKIANDEKVANFEKSLKKKTEAERKERFDAFSAATPTAKTRYVALAKEGFAEVPGKPITIKGFESADLFLSPSFVTEGFVVNEGTTGLAIGKGDTPQKAINDAKRVLTQQGAEKFAAAIARQKKAPSSPPKSRPTDRGGYIAIPGSGKPTQQPGKNFNLTMETTWDTIRRKVQDEFLPVQRMQEDIQKQGGKIDEQSEPYLATELFQGRAADQLKALETEYVQPVVTRMRRAGLTVADIDNYLIALHAPERNAHIAKINPKLPDGGSGMTNAEAAKVVAAVAASGKKADYDYVANSVHAMNEQTRKLQLDAGLITQEQHDAWGKYAKYVPLRTDMENGGMRTGQGFNIRGQESKRATGRTSEADSPLTFSLMQAQEKIVRAEKNRVGQAMLKLVEDNPDPDLWSINDRPTMQSVNTSTGVVQTTPDPMFQYADNVLAVKRDGKVHLIEFKGEQGKLIAAAMKRLNAAKFNVIVRGVQKVLTGYKALQTSYNPDFILPNLVRDLQTAGINIGADKSAKMAAATVKGVPKAWKAAFDVTGNKAAGTGKKYHDAMREYLANGGKVDSYATEGFDETSKAIEKQLREADPAGIDRARILVRGIGNAVDRINGATETAVRLSAYVQMRESGASPARAASFAKNLTVNFNRKGEWGSVINTLYVFSNASIQGSTRLLKSLTTTKRGAAVAGGIVASGIAYGMAAAAMFGEDEDGRKVWDRIPKHVKDTHLVLPRGGGKYFSIPLPYGYNVLFNAGRSTGEVLAGSETPGSAAFNTIKSAATAFNPLGGEGSALQMLSPTILDPFVQAAENKSWTGQPVVPEQMPFGLQKPDSQLSTRRTSATAKAVAQWLNRATGGDEVTPGKVDVSPAMLDHFFEFVVGGTGRTIERAAQLPGKDEIKSRDIPVVRRFVGEVPENPNLTEFYRTAKTIEDAYARTKHYLKSGDKDRARSYYKANKIELDMRRYIDEVRGKLKELREIEDKAVKQNRPDVVKKARDRMEMEARKFMTVFRRKGGSVPADPG